MTSFAERALTCAKAIITSAPSIATFSRSTGKFGAPAMCDTHCTMTH
jgi:hypothetical protein